jgi:4'-phosphopantetheinyl transferase
MFHHGPGWQLPPVIFELSSTDVHVWLAELRQVMASSALLVSILSAEERERAARFRFEHDHRQYVAAHVVLRLLLSQYMGQAPESIVFGHGRYGKPALALNPTHLPHPGPLHFNLSHSHGMILYAVALGREVGVDIEYIGKLLDRESVAAVAFSKSEQEALVSWPEPDRDKAFYTFWTRKEALIKAKGYGLHMSPDLSDVSLRPGKPVQLLDVRDAHGSPKNATPWSLCELPDIPGYSAALAFEGHSCALACWRWNDEQMRRLR